MLVCAQPESRRKSPDVPLPGSYFILRGPS
jgi:hypothetical protein